MSSNDYLLIDYNAIVSSIDDMISNLENGFKTVKDSDYGNWSGKAYEKFSKVKSSLNDSNTKLVNDLKKLKLNLEKISKLIGEYNGIEKEISPLETKINSYNDINELSDEDKKEKEESSSCLNDKKRALTVKKNEIDNCLSSL